MPPSRPPRIDRRRFLGATGGALAASLGQTDPPARTARAPSFLLVLADDLGYNDLGCFGSLRNPTPHLDKMATEGLRFTDFYAASPICTPTRAALLTGCYPKRIGMHHGALFPQARRGLHPDEITIADLLRSAGYATACIGKWHLGHVPELLPTRQGFERFFGLPYSHDMRPDLDPAYPPLPLYRDETVIETNPDPALLTARYTEEAIDFLRATRDRPFLLYLPHSMPHWPLAASARFRGRTASPYGDAVAEIDDSIGRILAALDDEGRADETLVLFTSDNGPRADGGSAHPLRAGKGSTWEGGMRVPALARWPG